MPIKRLESLDSMKKELPSKLVGVTQNVIIDQYGTRLDSMDQRWIRFLLECNISPLPIPNNKTALKKLIKQINFCGFLLTGGNDLEALGGNAPERDVAETLIIEYAIANDVPLFGVCRGMQIIQHYFGIKLQPVPNQVSKTQEIFINDTIEKANSYHKFGALETNSDLKVWAKSKDGIIKAVSHKKYSVRAIMWHPERISPFRKNDLSLFKNFFNPR